MCEQSNLFDPKTPKDTPPDSGKASEEVPERAPAGPESPSLSEPPALSVSEFNERVAGYLGGLFPGVFRIQGFVTGFQRSYARGGHVYFELHERDPADETRDVARIAMVIWRGVRQRVHRDIEALGGQGGALDDQQVYFEVSVNFWVQGGRLSLLVEGVDVEASLGAQKLDRERILRLLAAEDLLERNRRLALAPVPLRLGLITSLESAAYHDFLKELSQSGIGFRVACVDARVQGPEQEGDMLTAFARFTEHAQDWDAVVLIRGGGSRADLMGFDGEALARAIAVCPLPVLTGIGHEIDRSIADEVAHHALKTPTAAARFLVGRVEDWLTGLEETARQIRLQGERRLVQAGRDLDHRTHRLSALATAGLTGARARLAVAFARLPGAARQVLRLSRLELEQRRQLLPHKTRRPLALARLELRHRLARLSAAARAAAARPPRNGPPRGASAAPRPDARASPRLQPHPRRPRAPPALGGGDLAR